jgi:hypothetical protein
LFEPGEVFLGVSVYSNRYHARRAVLALLKMAKTTTDPKVAAGLIDAAADLKDQAGELPRATSGVKPSDARKRKSKANVVLSGKISPQSEGSRSLGRGDTRSIG